MIFRALKHKRACLIVTEKMNKEVLIPFSRDNSIPVPEVAHEFFPFGFFLFAKVLTTAIFKERFKTKISQWGSYRRYYKTLKRLKQRGYVVTRRVNNRTWYYIGLDENGQAIKDLDKLVDVVVVK